jgi:hypothetical protein
MSTDSFQNHYEQLTDDQLGLILADRQDLVPEAAEALVHEIQRRKLVMPKPPVWTRQPGSDERVQSLLDYEDFRQLVKRVRLARRYGYLIALGPFVLGLVVARQAFENSLAFMVATLTWAICVVVYCLILNTRYLGYRCPQCLQSFGRGAECFNCGFPSGATK